MTDASTCGNCGAHTTNQLCRACLGKAHRWLRDIADLAPALDETMTRQTRYTTGASKHGSDEVPLPFAVSPAIDTAVREIGTLREWAAHLADGALLHAARAAGTIPPTAQAREAARIITARREALTTDPQAAKCLDAIWATRAALQRAVDRPPPTRWYAGPCGHVTAWDPIDVCKLSLYATPGQDAITCDGHNDPFSAGCGKTHTMADRRVFLLANLRDELVDLDDLLAALPRLIGRNPDPGTVRSWRNRHKLVPRKLGGREYYRGGDVIDLALDRQPRSGPKRKDRRTA